MIRQVSPAAFKAGDIFANRKLWIEELEKHRANGFDVPPYFLKMVRAGEIDVMDSNWTLRKPSNIKFQKKHWGSWAGLAAADIPNSPTVDLHRNEVGAEICHLLRIGAIEEIDQTLAVESGSIVSPILWLRDLRDDGSVKCRLIHHSKINIFYSRPKFKMASIEREMYKLADLPGIRKCDLDSCFYQFPIGCSSQKLLRFKFYDGKRTRFFQWKVLSQGFSASPFIVNGLMRLITEIYGYKFGVHCSVYTDDFWHSQFCETPFDTFGAQFGLKFKAEKTIEGPLVVLLGIELNFTFKTARVRPEKAAKIAAEAKRLLAQECASSEEIAKFFGSVEFCSKVCRSGRINSFHLAKLAAEIEYKDEFDLKSDDCIFFGEGCLLELKFWSALESHVPLSLRQVEHECVSLLSCDASFMPVRRWMPGFFVF